MRCTAPENRDDRRGRRTRSGGVRSWLGLVVCALLGALLGPVGPAAAAAAGDWREVSAGLGHTCGVKNDGSAWCWGANSRGMLGDGTTTPHLTPTRVGSASDWLMIQADVMSTCGVRADNSLWCWGWNEFGQLGDGTTTDRLTPTRIGTAADWVDVDFGWYHTCAVKADGTLWCWGKNDDGQTGTGAEVHTPTQVGTATTWESVDLGAYHSCATRAAGTLWCWGSDYLGGLGIGNEAGDNPDEPLPVQVGNATDWSAVSAGRYHTCGLRDSSTLWCWGAGTGGQIGDNTREHRWSPVQIGTETAWEQVAAGYRNTCAVRADSTLWCWGDKAIGGLGVGQDGPRIVPEPQQAGLESSAVTGWTAVTVGHYNSCGIRDGSLWCWGHNYGGAIGDGTETAHYSPVLIS